MAPQQWATNNEVGTVLLAERPMAWANAEAESLIAACSFVRQGCSRIRLSMPEEESWESAVFKLLPMSTFISLVKCQSCKAHDSLKLFTKRYPALPGNAERLALQKVGVKWAGCAVLTVSSAY